jgi:hypothetical protein
LAEDTAEYHVVRNGVDHQLALKQFFDSAGFDCAIRPYWSTQSTLFQHLAEKPKLANTFGIIAQKKRGLRNRYVSAAVAQAED